MSTIDLHNLSNKSVLITRSAARLLAEDFREASQDGKIVLDTSGILRIGVSFFDESLLIFKEVAEATTNTDLQLIYSKAPTMQSLKKLVKNRELILSETTAGDWAITLTHAQH